MTKMIRWDKLPDNFDKTIRDRMLQNFWLPEKYPISNDLADWKTLDDKQKRVFNLTLGGLTLLDTYQTEAVTSLMNNNKDMYETSNLAIISQQECYHKDTEILTPNGWKLIKDMNIGDDVFQYNIDGSINKTKVKNVIHRNIEPTQLIEIKKDSYHTCVTPNHDMAIYENNSYKKIKAKELLNKDYINNNKIEVIINSKSYQSFRINKNILAECVLYAFMNSLKFNIDKLYHKKYIKSLTNILKSINYEIIFKYDAYQYYKFISLKDKNNNDVINYKYDITKISLGELQDYLDLFLKYLNYGRISKNSYIDDYVLESIDINIINELKTIFDRLGYYYKMINNNKIYFERSYLINHKYQSNIVAFDHIKVLILEKSYLNKHNNYVIEFDKSDPIRMRLNGLDTSLFDRKDTVNKHIYVFKNLRFNFNLELLSPRCIYNLIEHFQIINNDKGNVYTGKRKDIFTTLVTLNGGTFVEENNKVIFNFDSNINLLQINNENISLTKPETEVYCVSVNSGIIITKYKGRLAINGNCVHSASYSNIFMTLLSTSDIDQLVRDVEASEYNKKRESIINDMYNQKDYFIKRVASVFLESFTFYSGFYYVLYLNTRQKMINSGDTIRSIMTDEASHGGYIGYKARNYYNNKVDNIIKQYLNSLMDNEVRYVQYLYDDIGLTSDVIKFLHYNANRALMNLGLDHLMYSREKSNCSEAIKAAISDESTNHDFFTTVGNTTSYQIAKTEETIDDDWN